MPALRSTKVYFPLLLVPPIFPNSRTETKQTDLKTKPKRVGLIASVLEKWKPKAPPQTLTSPALDRKSDRKAAPPRPLPSLVQLASHGSLRRTLAKDCWPAFRAVCRSILVKYAQASKSKNESQKHRCLVELLNVPSQALLIRNGNVKRTNSQSIKL